MPSLEVLNGPEAGKRQEIQTETFFIGRDPNNHLSLMDRTVSRKHAVINQLEGKYVLSDLKSLKGVLINGEKKEEAVLEGEDEIAIGAVRLRFHSEKKLQPVLGKKRTPLWVGLLCLVLFAGAGLLLWQKGFFQANQNGHLEAIRQNYEEGIHFFNEAKDLEGAKRRFEKVLELDPERKTPYANKALKLLENLK